MLATIVIDRSLYGLATVYLEATVNATPLGRIDPPTTEVEVARDLLAIEKR